MYLWKSITKKLKNYFTIIDTIEMFPLKFMFSKKATKIDEIFTIDVTITTYCQIDGEAFVNFLWHSQKTWTLTPSESFLYISICKVFEYFGFKNLRNENLWKIKEWRKGKQTWQIWMVLLLLSIIDLYLSNCAGNSNYSSISL